MKKAQAAIEFLMTYGWAILIVIVGLGTLVYAGVFDFNLFLADSCSFSLNLNCEQFKVESGIDGSITLKIRNNIGNSATIMNMELFDRDCIDCEIPICIKDFAALTPPGLVMDNGKAETIIIPSQGDLYYDPLINGCSYDRLGLSGDIKRFDINVLYYLGSPSFTHPAVGELLIRVE